MTPRKSLTAARADALAAVFKDLGNTTRLRLLDAIAREEQCVHDLTEALGLEQSAASHQLRRLEDRDLVKSRKEGRHVFYALADEHVQVLLDVGLAHVAHRRKR